MFKFYQKLQKWVDEYNQQINQNEDLPLSLNRQKLKNIKNAPPILTLRAKYIMERLLPIFKDQNSLTIMSAEKEILM